MTIKYQMKDIDSCSELLEQFKLFNGPKLLIDNSDYSPNQYKLILLESFTIGLINHSFGIPLQIETLDNNSTFLIGHEREIDCISSSKEKILWKVLVNSVFIHFEIIPEEKLIIIIEETSVMALDFN